MLTEAAVNGSVDHLLGLKENVIIGRLIPARLDRSEEGRKKLGLDTIKHRIEGTLTGTTQAPPSFEDALRAFGGEEILLGDGSGEASAAGNGGSSATADSTSGEGEGLAKLLAAITSSDEDKPASKAKAPEEAEAPGADD